MTRLNGSQDTQQQLKAELDWLKATLQRGDALQVVWTPQATSLLSGEVNNNILNIYETDGTKALDNLRHEFIDHIRWTEGF